MWKPLFLGYVSESEPLGVGGRAGKGEGLLGMMGSSGSQSLASLYEPMEDSIYGSNHHSYQPTQESQLRMLSNAHLD